MMLDTYQVAEVFGQSRQYIRRLCVAGKLPGARRIGGVWIIPSGADERLVSLEDGCDSRFVGAEFGYLRQVQESLVALKVGVEGLLAVNKRIKSLRVIRRELVRASEIVVEVMGQYHTKTNIEEKK